MGRTEVTTILITTIAFCDSGFGGSGLYLENAPDFTCTPPSNTSSYNVPNTNFENTCPCANPIFSKLFRETTISTEYNLICEKSTIPQFITSSLLSSGIIASFTIGPFADKFGYKFTAIRLLLISITSGVLINTTKSLLIYTICRNIQFFAIHGTYIVGLSITRVIKVSENLRNSLTILFLAIWSLGLVVLPLAGFVFRSWTGFQWYLTGSVVFAFVGLLVYDESLDTVQDEKKVQNVKTVDEEVENVTLIANDSRDSLSTRPSTSDNVYPMIQIHKSEPTESEIFSILDLTRPAKIILFKILCLLFTMGLVLFIFILDSRQVGMNFYAYKSIMAVIDIPFSLAIDPILKKKSHRYCYKVFYAICILSNMLLVLIKLLKLNVPFFEELDNESFWALLILSLTGRGAVAGLWNFGYILISNHMPSGIRATTLGMAAGAATLGGAAAPLILMSNSILDCAPDAVCAIVLVVTWLVTYDIPEPSS